MARIENNARSLKLDSSTPLPCRICGKDTVHIRAFPISEGGQAVQWRASAYCVECFERLPAWYGKPNDATTGYR